MSAHGPYHEYKNSEVKWLGGIPIAWGVRPLWTLFRRSKQLGSGEEELLSVYRDYGVIPKSSRDDNNNRPSDDLSKYQLVRVGDLVINKMKAWQGSVAVSEYEGIVSPAYFVYASRSNNDLRYLHYLLRSQPYIGAYASISKGVRPSQWDLDPDQHRILPVLLPSATEQRAIACFLDHETSEIDAFISDQEELITLLNERRAATITQAVTKGLNPEVPMKDSGVASLGEIPADWCAIKMRYLAKIETGSSDTADAVEGGEYPFFVRSDTVETIGKYSYDTEAVLTAGDGAGVGKVFHHFTGKFEAHQRVYVMHHFRGVLGRYFYFYLSTLFGSVVLAGTAKSTVDSLRRPMFNNFHVAVPTMQEQKEIVDHLAHETAEIDAAIADAKEAIELSKERRAALISAAVTGKIDVRGYINAELGAA